MIKKDDVFRKKYLLISHYATYSQQDLLYEYLLYNKSEIVTKINIPLPDLPFLKNIEIETATNGVIRKKKEIKTIVRPPLFAYLFHPIQVFLAVLFSPHSYDILIAQNSLLAIAGLLLRRFSKTKKVIYYSHGIDKSRFQKNFLNNLYQQLDLFAAQKSDGNWVLNQGILQIRNLKSEVEWVPTAISRSSIPAHKRRDMNRCIFIGTLNDMNGTMLLPQVVQRVIKTVPDFHMDIIGDGPYLQELEQAIINKKLENNVTLHGLMSFNKYSDTLGKYAVAIAPYKPLDNNLLATTDPMKIRLYIAAGIPIVLTKGFSFSKEVVENKIGQDVKYNSALFANMLIKFITDKKMNLQMHSNALNYAKKFEPGVLYYSALKKI